MMPLERITRGKEIKKSVGMLRIISERTLDNFEQLWACCIDWQKAFDRGN